VSGSYEGAGHILGGLPVYAYIDCGKDSDTPNGPGEYWSEVRSLHWLKKDGTPGKELPKHIVERAEKYDYGFCTLMENIAEQLAYEEYQKAQP
jgi:hypothetical protein